MDLPEDHAVVLRRLRDSISADERFVGLAAGGSLVAGGMDAYSDLDLLVIVESAHHAAVMPRMRELAGTWGKLLVAFTGEHVGEPRLLICLYDDPLLHVDLKFLTPDEVGHRVQDPVVLWERGSAVSAVIGRTSSVAPAVDEQWIEDRFWVWVHYVAAKLGRGELYEVLDCLSYLRGQVLGPLGMARRGLEPRGARRIEEQAPDLAAALEATVAGYDPRQCRDALEHCIELYRGLRAPGLIRRTAAEEASVRYLAGV
jgi:hypothetical protein